MGAPYARAVDHFNRNLKTAQDDTTRPNGGHDAESAGAVYVFRRVPEIRGGLGGLVGEPFWAATEAAKLQPPIKRAGDLVGQSVAMDGYQAVIGAPREPVAIHTAGLGAVHAIDMGFQQLRFTQKEVVVNEFNFLDDPGYVELVVARSGDTSEALHVGYATSDITAIGISPGESVVCLAAVPANRAECGDYILNSGILTFLPGVSTQNIKVYIIDDYCPCVKRVNITGANEPDL